MKFKKIFQESCAMIFRDIKKSGGFKKQIIHMIIALIILTLLSLGLNNIFSQPAKDYTLFFAGGIAACLISITSFLGVLNLVADKRKFIRILLIAPISRISILIGKSIYLFITLSKLYLSFLIIIIIYFNFFNFIKIFLILIIIFLIVLIFSGLGFIVLAFVNDYKKVQTISTISTMIFYLLSGVFYPIDILPNFLRYFVYANPVTYTSDLMRHVIAGEGIFSLQLILIVNVLFITIIPLTGIYLFDRRLRKGLYY